MYKGRLKVDVEYMVFIKLVLESTNYIYRTITPEIAMLSVDLFSDNNKDPADRIIAATSIIENVKLVTADKRLRRSGRVTTIW
jgi:PIN domain nuclease of toxin-antitoxin system